MLPARRLPLLGRPVVDVAVGVLRAPDGRVLLTERRPGKDAAGFWELPGGQIEPGESPAQAAARELLEEVGIQADELAPWRVYEHDFPSKRVRLHWFNVRRWSGEANGWHGSTPPIRRSGHCCRATSWRLRPWRSRSWWESPG